MNLMKSTLLAVAIVIAIITVQNIFYSPFSNVSQIFDSDDISLGPSSSAITELSCGEFVCKEFATPPFRVPNPFTSTGGWQALFESDAFGEAFEGLGNEFTAWFNSITCPEECPAVAWLDRFSININSLSALPTPSNLCPNAGKTFETTLNLEGSSMLGCSLASLEVMKQLQRETQTYAASVCGADCGFEIALAPRGGTPDISTDDWLEFLGFTQESFLSSCTIRGQLDVSVTCKGLSVGNVNSLVDVSLSSSFCKECLVSEDQ